MSVYRTDDPHADFDRHEAEQAAELEKLPKCSDCGEPIQDELYFEIEGTIYCEECLNANYRKSTDNY